MAMPAIPPGAPAVKQVRRLSNVLTRQIAGKQDVQTLAALTTFHTTATLECKAGRFRAILHNVHTSPVTITTVSIAVSNQLGSGAQQYTPSGAWDLLRFGGLASVTLPAGAIGDPSITVSDWFTLGSLDRVDGGVLPIVMFRVVLPAGSYSRGAYDLTPWAAENGIAQKRLWAMWSWVGNAGASATPTDFVGTPTGFPILLGFEYGASRPGVTFHIGTDSIGEGAVNNFGGNFGNGWAWQAVMLLRAMFPQIPIELMNASCSATATNTFTRRLNKVIAAGIHFDVSMYVPFSPNDGTPTQAQINADLLYMSQYLNLCYDNNKQVLLVTPCPNTAANWDAIADALRLFLRTEIVASGQLAPYVDLNILSNGATPNRFNASDTTDLTHPNENGAGRVALLQAAPAMARMIKV